MSKTKSKNRSENEYFNGKIRKLESENRQLKKRLKALDKRQHLYDDIIEVIAEDIVIDEKCKKCKNGSVSLIDLKYAKFLVCNECKDRTKV